MAIPDPTGLPPTRCESCGATVYRVTCAQCHRLVTSRSDRVRFCSTTCRVAWHRAHNHE